MFLELLNNVFIDSSLFYLYVGILLITFGVMYFNHLYNSDFIKNDYLITKQAQNIKVNLVHMKSPKVIEEPFTTWLIMTFKRINEQDDKEDSSISYFKSMFKIRGGQLWKRTSYPQLLKNHIY